jgi:beta-glucosidase/6-phospho-beta-glucosidase/beta-galactosidase
MLDSFFLAGFECATGYNRFNNWIDQVKATQHDRFIDQDYQRLTSIGICGVREGIRWPLVDQKGHYDFSTLHRTLDAANRNGLQVIHDLFHFGYPNDLDPFSEDFVKRYEDYCYAAAGVVSHETDGICFFTPINEPSYFSWAAGEAGLFAPHTVGRGFELKVNLARAAIRGIEAIWSACHRARIVNADSLCHVVSPNGNHSEEVRFFNENAVFQAWDMIAGRMLPELGGSSRHLDVVGINYYWTNQWELGKETIPLSESDSRRLPFRKLIQWVYDRYECDLIVTETAHLESMREVWLKELMSECEILLKRGVPLHGVCIYPVLGMPEWHHPEQWTHMGLWDLVPNHSSLLRIPYLPALNLIRHNAARFENLKREASLTQNETEVL